MGLRYTEGAVMNVSLTPDQERLVQGWIDNGRYESAADVIGEAVRLLEERERFLNLRKEDVHQKILDGLESLRLGKGVDGEAEFERIVRELDAVDRNAGA